MHIRGVRFSTGLVLCLAPLAAGRPDAFKLLDSAPLRFEPAGQGRFIGRGFHRALEVAADRVWLGAGDDAAMLRFDGANAKARINGAAKLASTTNVFRGQDPSRWRTGIANYERVQVDGLYRGIDLVYYGHANELEYDLIVAPGADPNRIRLRVTPLQPVLRDDGILIGDFLHKRPVAYQIGANGTRMPVASRYRSNADGTFGISLGHYDRGRELIIDPVVTLASYLSGTGQSVATAIGHDSNGFIYVAGTTAAADFPNTGTSFSQALSGNSDVFVVKLDPNASSGSRIVYSTFFGGSGAETLGAMFVTPTGNVYLAGSTTSNDLPRTNAAQTALSGPSDAFVVWLNPSLSGTDALQYSTYVGGGADDFAEGIAVDSKGRIVITGWTQSSDFPVVGGFQTVLAGKQDAFTAEIDPTRGDQSTLVYSTYMGGGSWDVGRSVAVAQDDTWWVVGGTFSFDFPLSGYDYQPNYQAGGDAFAVHIDPSQGSNALVYGTFIGGSSVDEAKKVIIDSAGRLIITGYTVSSDFPVTPDALQAQYGGNTDAFVAILDPSITTSRAAQLVYATYFGGANGEVAYDVKQDAAGNIYIAGFTMSPNLPASHAIQPSYSGAMNGFVLGFNPVTGTQLFSYFGGSGIQIANGVDIAPDGTVYLAGFTTGPVFDALGGPSKPSSQGNTDGFVVGFKP